MSESIAPDRDVLIKIGIIALLLLSALTLPFFIMSPPREPSLTDEPVVFEPSTDAPAEPSTDAPSTRSGGGATGPARPLHIHRPAPRSSRRRRRDRSERVGLGYLPAVGRLSTIVSTTASSASAPPCCGEATSCGIAPRSARHATNRLHAKIPTWYTSSAASPFPSAAPLPLLPSPFPPAGLPAHPDPPHVHATRGACRT